MLARSILLTFVAAMPLCAGCSGGKSPDVSHQMLTPTDNLCEDVDDHEQLQKLTQDLIELDKSGGAVDTKRLMEQLERSRCEVAFARPRRQRLTAAKLYEQCRRSVVVVASLYRCPTCGKMHASVASGFVVGAGGVVATDYHVVDKPENKAFAVMDVDGRIYAVREVLATDKDEDIAILRTEAVMLEPLAVAADAPVGSHVAVISHPGRRFFLITQGDVSAYSMSEDGGAERMFITADFGMGSSGGPVLNRAGNVVGMVRSTIPVFANGGEGVKYAQMVIKSCVTGKALRTLIRGQ